VKLKLQNNKKNAEFWDLHYKIQPGLDHVAKFQSDRSRDLGERVAKKKKNITGKTEDLPLIRTGGLKMNAKRNIQVY